MDINDIKKLHDKLISNFNPEETIKGIYTPNTSECQCEEEDCVLSCQSNCQKSCQGELCGLCEDGAECSGECESSYQACNYECETYCEIDCQSSCEYSCQTSCQKDCQSTCENSCQSTCEKSCEACEACQSSCELSTQSSAEGAYLVAEFNSDKTEIEIGGDCGSFNASEYYIDIYDQEEGNNGWHMLKGWTTYYTGVEGICYVSDYPNLDSFQFRVRFKDSDGNISEWVYSNTLEAPVTKPSKFYGFDDLGGSIETTQIDENTYIAPMLSTDLYDDFCNFLNKVRKYFGMSTYSFYTARKNDASNFTLCINDLINCCNSILNNQNINYEFDNVSAGDKVRRSLFLNMQDKINDLL